MIATRYFLFLLLVLTLLLSSCLPSTQNLQGEHWIIFSAEQASEWKVGSWFFLNGENLDYWTPTEDNILALEKELGAYLQANSDRFYEKDIPVWDRLDEYNRQYIGIILDGKQVIYANYFCDSAQLDWRKDFVFVMDGGDCFFQFNYNVDSADFFDLQVNGSA